MRKDRAKRFAGEEETGENEFPRAYDPRVIQSSDAVGRKTAKTAKIAKIIFDRERSENSEGWQAGRKGGCPSKQGFWKKKGNAVQKTGNELQTAQKSVCQPREIQSPTERKQVPGKK